MRTILKHGEQQSHYPQLSQRHQALALAPWNGRIGRFTLLEAARQVSALHPAADLFSPGWSLLVLLAWPTAGLAAAALVITRRDA